MLRQWLIVAVCVFCTSLPVLHARICEEVSVWNYMSEFEKTLRGCTVITGSLKILLIEKANIQDFHNLSFPELTEIKGYLLLYRVSGLTSLGRLFPNLSAIRGLTLLKDYSIVLYEVNHLQEIGLTNLKYIARGSTRIERCSNICYVKTIDWSRIAHASHVLDTFDMNEDCQSCPPQCNGLCWNQKHCQLTGPDNCDPECIGCRGPSPDQCYACRSYTDNGRCVSHCPPDKVPHSLVSYCVTKQECPTLLNGTWWIFQGECVNTCPPKYMQVSEEDGWCSYCGDNCKKKCSGTHIDSIASAQLLRGCTHINGSLSIRIDAKSTADELEDCLGMIEEIDGCLRIYRSHPLTTLEFFKKLRVIHGYELDNKRHALVVYENQNLYKLWNWDNFTLAIKNGTISFHFNQQLCLSEIEKLAEVTGVSYSTIDVSPYSNGDKTACNFIDLKVSLVVHSKQATLTWENLLGEESSVIGYLLYYIEDPIGNMTIYDECDECDANGWDTIFVSNNSKVIENLKAFTQYAYYIKTYTSTSSARSQTVIRHFTTLSDDPSVPLDVKAISSSSDGVTLLWKPPEFPNGVLSFYDIIAYYEEDDFDLIAQRDYCLYPHVRQAKQKEISVRPNIWSNSTTNATCCKVTDKLSTGIFDALCDQLHNLSLDSGPNQCKDYKYSVDGNFGTNNQDILSIQKRREVIVRQIKNTNLTSYDFKPLQHFSTYVFLLRACNNDTALHCSSPVMASQRTLRREKADDIQPGLSAHVDSSDVFVKWYEPKKPNSVIVSYIVEHRRKDLEHSKISRECITRQQFAQAGYVHIMRHFLPGKYLVAVKAVSLAGEGRFSDAVEFDIYPPSHGASPAYFIAPFFVFVFVVVGIFYYYHYHKRKHKLDNLHLITNINPDYAGPIYVEDEWELERDDVEISKALGQGTFGMVYSGFIKSKNRPCAVKTVNDSANVHEQMVFLNEASVMKSFNDAHHVVKLIGVVSRGQPALVVMELMGRGDLKSFLRRSRDSSSSITCAEMYRMAAEIADGMLYLAAKKFVHRDLAARNCMVGSDHTVKIGDFGMTRDIYETDYYRKETRGLMPVRWMSPESLADGVFTTDADVWSYGVVLWEMVTLAEQPYQGLANEQVLQFVIAQGTLERPPECPDLLYEIMSACWKWRPNQRPLFADIVDKLEPNVGQNFRLVSFYHSSGGEEYRMNAKDRVYNPPALAVPLDRNKSVHWHPSDDDVSLYSSFESNRPTPLLSSFQHQSNKNTPSDSSYR